MPSQRISACLIVQDEQERLPAALASVAFCDETIVIDGGSSDRTVAIAREAGARVIESPWPGFAAQRNVALDAADGDWILEIDADERVSPALRTSIQALLLAHPPASAAMAVCALRNRFLGGALGPSAKYPAYRARVFRRDSYRHDESRAVHEGIEPRERPVVLDGDLEHELAGTLHEAIVDTWRYARLESLHVARPSRIRDCLIGIVLRPTAKLVYRTLVDGGWRDGWRGLLKISLDATSDGLVWVLAIARGVRADAGSPDGVRQGHFGRRPVGPPKVVAVSSGGRAAEVAAGWLTDLRARGMDVALVAPVRSAGANGAGGVGDGVDTGANRAGGVGDAVDTGASDEGVFYEGVPLQTVKHLSPLAVIRALEIEMQLRTIDAVVTVGRRAELVRPLIPRTLRPDIPGLDTDLSPQAAGALVGEAIARR